MIYRLLSGVGEALGVGLFLGLLVLFSIMGEVAIRCRIWLLEALFIHGALAAIAVIVLDNLAGTLGAYRVVGGGPAGPSLLVALGLAALCGIPLALACLKQHVNYVSDGDPEIAALVRRSSRFLRRRVTA
ncbi:MAG: hypothetical protein ACRECF_10565 [Methyloceanibacter sp.]